MKSNSRVFLCIFCFSLFACSSNSIHVPGESRIILKNVATEYYAIAEGYMDLKKYDKAAEYYKLAMRNKDLYMTAYYKLARSYALAKNWEKASEAYTALLKRDKDNTMLKTSLAYITAMRGETEKALVQYKNLLSENPYDENLLESYVALLINTKRGSEAEEYFFVLKEKFPDNKQITSFAQDLSELVETFDPEKNPKDAQEAGDSRSDADSRPNAS